MIGGSWDPSELPKFGFSNNLATADYCVHSFVWRTPES